MDKNPNMVSSEHTDFALKAWETPTFERYDARRETQSKYATVTEYTSTTGPAS